MSEEEIIEDGAENELELLNREVKSIEEFV